MPARKSKKWKSTKKPSLGQLRRAHPASGATWNVQVVRGKMTSKCLWHACRALILGILLMLLGASMATIGYYADQLSIGHEIRGNATVRVKNESRGFHLNNFSYAGPIVMGFGGFIVVAACVMTFEARDSAAKVVPARFKISTSSRSNIRSNSSSSTSNRRANGIMHQATRWDHHLGVFRTSPAEPPPQPIDRQALTAALIHFSKTLGTSPRLSPKTKRFSLTGSVPNLSSALTSNRSSINSAQLSPLYRRHLINNINANSLSTKQLILQQLQQQHHYKSKHHYHNNHHHHHRHRHLNDEISGDDASKTNENEKVLRNSARKSRTNGTSASNHCDRPFTKSRTSRTSTSLINRSSRDNTNSGSLLHPGKLHQMHRHAMSVDESGPYSNTSDIEDSSLMSVIKLNRNHEQRIRDRNRRSDTAKKHILSRQKPIEPLDDQQNHQNTMNSSVLDERRRSSTTSDASYASRYRASSATSRTNSIDSRSIQVELHSPEKHQRQQHYYQNRMSPHSPRRKSSTSSMDREFRSQMSVCSEPGTVIRQLSGQSSLEPCVLEESPESEEKDKIVSENEKNSTFSKPINENSNEVSTISANVENELHTPVRNFETNSGSNSPIYCNIRKKRPQSLKINTNNTQVMLNSSKNSTKQNTTVAKIVEKENTTQLQRSNSSRAFYRSKPKSIKEYETQNHSEDSVSIGTYLNYYNISSASETDPAKDNDFYDSLRVINERRNKILKTESESNSQIKSIETKISIEDENHIKNQQANDDNQCAESKVLNNSYPKNSNSIKNLDNCLDENLNNTASHTALNSAKIKLNSKTIKTSPLKLKILASNIVSNKLSAKSSSSSSSSTTSLQSLVRENILPTIECDTSVKSTTIPINKNENKEVKINNNQCTIVPINRENNNRNSSSNTIDICDIKNSTYPCESKIEKTEQHINNMKMENDSQSKSTSFPLHCETIENINTSEINCVSSIDDTVYVIAIDDDSKNEIHGVKVLSNDKNCEKNLYRKNDNLTIDITDVDNDNVVNVNSLKNENPKDTRIVIGENVN